MNEANQPTTVTVRALLAHFHGILAQARRSGEPVVIALRRRTPAGVLLGYETWQALQTQPPVQADTPVLQAELAAERQRNRALAAELAAARRQVEDMGRDLAAVCQRVAVLEAQLTSPQPADAVGAGWRMAPQPEPPTLPLNAWGRPAQDSSEARQPPVPERWGQRGVLDRE